LLIAHDRQHPLGGGKLAVTAGRTRRSNGSRPLRSTGRKRRDGRRRPARSAWAPRNVLLLMETSSKVLGKARGARGPSARGLGTGPRHTTPPGRRGHDGARGPARPAKAGGTVAPGADNQPPEHGVVKRTW
jgi:hypothetical protein